MTRRHLHHYRCEWQECPRSAIGYRRLWATEGRHQRQYDHGVRRRQRQYAEHEA